ncbi:hypothetical protein TDMWS_12440 [Thermodesulfomicrobium sp. WS]|nr:hypothetical protein TDMWS_12440 [Thermodesulfomicrobium sp. WS]
MRLGKTSLVLGVGILWCGSTLWGASASMDMEARVRSQCFHCHGGEKLCQATDDPNWWQRAVDRMVQYQDGLLQPEEVPSMAAWLADASNRKHWCAKNTQGE